MDPTPNYSKFNPCGWDREDSRRHQLMALIQQPQWDRAIVGIIVLNGFTMAFERPDRAQELDPSWFDAVPEALELIYLCLFTAEMTVKLTAMGIRGYFIDSWNLLDSAVVCTGWAPLLLPFIADANLSAMRLLRLLRVLMLVRKVDSMRHIVVVLFASTMQLADVFSLFCFFMFVYGLIGLQLFMGQLHWRCVPDGVNASLLIEGDWGVCAEDGSQPCAAGTYCAEVENPEHGLTSYDNIFSSFLTIFVAVSLEGWTDQMYLLQKTLLHRWAAVVFYVTMVTLGGLFIVQLFLAIIFNNFIKKSEADADADDDDDGKRDELAALEQAAAVAASEVAQASEGMGVAAARRASLRAGLRGAALSADAVGRLSRRASSCDAERDRDGAPSPVSFSSRKMERRPTKSLTKLTDEQLRKCRSSVCLKREASHVASLRLEDDDVNEQPLAERLRLYVLAAAPDANSTFNRVALGLIVLNTLSMTMHTYGDSAEKTRLLEMCNTLFTTLFMGEAALRIHGLGWAGYWADGWNKFDFVVTACSAVELLLVLISLDNPYMRALRAGRILRLLRVSSQMVRFEYTISHVAPYIASIAGLIFLFTFIFALLGMELFGYELGSPPPRSNFDTIGAALVTVFVIITGEDWNENLAIALGATSAGKAVPYFCILYAVGNYLLVSLCVAVVSAGWSATKQIEDLGVEESREEIEERRQVEDAINGLREAHIRLLGRLQEQIQISVLGFSKSSVHTLAAMNDTLNEYVQGVRKVVAMPGDAPPELGALTVAFETVIHGVNAMLPYARSRVPPQEPAKPVERYLAKPLTPGCTWDNIGSQKPNKGHEVSSAALADALKAKSKLTGVDKVEFAEDEWKALGIPNVSDHDFVSSGDAYFQTGRGNLTPSATYTADATCAYSDEQLLALQFMEATAVYDDYDDDGDDYERRPFSSVPQLQAMPQKYIRALCDVDEQVQMLHRIAEVVKKDRPRLEPLLCLHLDGVGYESILGEPQSREPSLYQQAQRGARKVIKRQEFEAIVQLAIVLSCVSLACESPEGETPGSLRAIIFLMGDWVFTSLFTAELVLKVFVYGLYAGPEAYLKSGWNLLDATIVCTSLPSLLVPALSQLQLMRVVRALRALRPLVLIKRFKNVRQVVYSLGRALPKVSRVAYVCLLLMMVYALFGMALLKGTTASCNDASIVSAAACVGSFVDPDGRARTRWWGNPDMGNFDSFGGAMLTLFEMSTLEMWPDVLHLVVDTVAPGVPPQTEASPWMAAYVILWILLSNFFLLQLFVGVTLETFNEIRRESDGSGFLTPQQNAYQQSLLRTLTLRPVCKLTPPDSPVGQRAFRVVTSTAFDIFISAAVVVSLIAMAATWYHEPLWATWWNSLTNYAFLALFTAEMGFKIFALGRTQYFNSAWNVFDFSLVTSWLLAEGGKLIAGTWLKPEFLMLLRIVRVARLVRLVQISPGIRRMLATLALSAPALVNVGILLSLIMYIYAIIGVQLFHLLAPGEFNNEEANFTSFGMALLTLFRCITGESYNGLMHDAMVSEALEPGRCDEAAGTCGTWVAIPYHVSFQIIGVQVVLQLVLAAILDTFDAAEEGFTLSNDQLLGFRDKWAEFDVRATHYILSGELVPLLRALPQPLGFGGNAAPDEDIAVVARRLKLKLHKQVDVGGGGKVLGSLVKQVGRFHFHDVLSALTRDLHDRSGKKHPVNKRQRDIQQKFVASWQKRPNRIGGPDGAHGAAALRIAAKRARGAPAPTELV